MDKWTAFALVIAGIALIIFASRMKSSFEDGTFFGQIMLGLFGVILVLSGVIWFVILLFINL